MSADLGWIQCSQCGWGCEVHRAEVEAGDYIDRQGCPECGLGPCRIDWDYPDGPGWKYEEGGRYESCGVHPERVE